MELEVGGLSKNGEACLEAVLSFEKNVAGMRGIENPIYEVVITEVLEKLARLELEPQEAAKLIEEEIGAHED